MSTIERGPWHTHTHTHARTGIEDPRSAVRLLHSLSAFIFRRAPRSPSSPRPFSPCAMRSRSWSFRNSLERQRSHSFRQTSFVGRSNSDASETLKAASRTCSVDEELVELSLPIIQRRSSFGCGPIDYGRRLTPSHPISASGPPPMPSTAPNSISGALRKQSSSGVLKMWKKRWFFLKGQELVVYHHEEMTKMSNVYNLPSPAAPPPPPHAS